MQSPESSTRRSLLKSTLATGAAALLAPRSAAAQVADSAPRSTVGLEDRQAWVAYLERVSEPVLHALSQRRLRADMPVEAVAGQTAARAVGSHLEALGRLLCGIAPWLELEAAPGEPPAETQLRSRYRAHALTAIASAVDPASPDYMRFGQSAQTLVDSSFLSLALLRAPNQLLGKLDSATRQRLIDALLSERTVQPPFNNWLLFAALNEALLYKLGAPWDRLRIDYALREHASWYLGDGTYGDGPEFHADFYNSFVIHPYLLELSSLVGSLEPAWNSMQPRILARAQRYAAIQERMISPRGEYPVLGRSITYRAGAFHLLADAALRHLLPAAVQPAQVRCALTAVLDRTLRPADTFSASGWLQIGLCGHQPSLGETYISTGSLYLCAAAFLPLGLPLSDAFWSAPSAPWTQQLAWSGHDLPADHALHEDR